MTLFLAADFVTGLSRFQAPFETLVRYELVYMPNIIYQLVPAACLIATLFTLSTLNKSNELVALYSMGMSLFRVSAPILGQCALISLVTFYVGDRALPILNQKRDYIYYVELKKRPGQYQTVKTNRIWYRNDNIIYNIRSIEADHNRAQGLNMYYFNEDWHLIQLIKAKDVRFINNGAWELLDGTVTLFAEESSFPLTKSFDKKVVQVSQDIADIQSAPSTAEIMSVADLKHFIDKNKELGLSVTRFETDYYAKWAFATAGLLLALLGIPFATNRERSGGNMKSIAIASGLAAGYWVSFGASVSLGYQGLLPPLYAAWIPNIAILAMAVYKLHRSPV